MEKRIVGIMGAMHEEIHAIVPLLAQKTTHEYGQRIYYTGTINGIKVVVVFSRWGKVASATTVLSLILKFNITELFFIGVAGAIDHHLSVGDIVIAERLVQHDMDARPLMKQYEIPLLGVTYLKTDKALVAEATKAVRSVIDNYHTSARLYIGTIASGDRFFANLKDKEILQKNLPNVLCVEMEGAAVAQVCYEYSIPFAVIRIISDEANNSAHIDFPAFVAQVSSKYAAGIVERLLS